MGIAVVGYFCGGKQLEPTTQNYPHNRPIKAQIYLLSQAFFVV
jgi:hypothetical protein